MAKKLGIACIIAILMIAGMIIFSGVSIAAPPPPPGPPSLPPTPTPVPPSPPSGGSSPSYSSGPTFQSSTVNLCSSDGTVIGSLTSVDYSTVKLKAAKSGIVNGKNHSVDIAADISYMPNGATLDINLGPEGNVPEGMDNVIVLSSAILKADSTNGWSLKSGVTVRFTIPAAELPPGSDAKCYLVHFDGSSYHMVEASVTSNDGIATIEAVISSIKGTITAVMPCAPAPVLVADPTPEPTISPTAQPTPAHETSSGILGWLPSIWVSTFGMFAIGETAGAAILLVVGRLFK